MTRSATMIHFDAVDAHMGTAQILHGCSIRVRRGGMHGLVGPNGSGKSTLLRLLYRSLRPSAGTIWIGTDDIDELHLRALARRRSTVPQDAANDLDFTVRELVEIGRSACYGPLQRLRKSDHEVVNEALRSVDLAWARDRTVSTLSGGERQRAFIARALAQEAEVICLDEPTNHLDIGAQFAILDLLESLRITSVIALHDLAHAATYCDEVTVLSGGRVTASGPPQTVLTPELVQHVFGVRSHVAPHPITGRPHLCVAPPGDLPALERTKT